MTHIQQRRDTASNWTSVNPVLYLGEVGWETDTRNAKLGDGVTAWNDLDYVIEPPSYPVTSVAGQTGAVLLDKTDVGLSNVNNTSDLAKPISTATQTALDGKAGLANPAFTGTPTAPTAATATDNTQVATTGFVHDVVDDFAANAVFSGAPEVPTAATSEDSDVAASTAFVHDLVDESTPFAMAAGLVTLTFSGGTQSNVVPVTFPVGRFSLAPVVTLTVYGAGFSNLTVVRMSGAPNASGFSAVANASSATSGSMTAAWQAVQMTELDSSG